MAHPIEKIKQVIELDAEQEQSLKALMFEQRFRRGERISSMPFIRSHTFYVMQGSARVFYIRGGKEHTFSFAFEDEFVTMSLCLLDDPYSQLAIEFLEPTDIVMFPIADMRSFMQKVSATNFVEVSTLVITSLLALERAQEERLMMLQSSTASERYQWLLTRYPRITERATITQIASFLGVTKETLYRIRAGKYNKK